MRRIALAVVLALVLSAAPLVGEAQQAKNVPRIGFLSAASPAAVSGRIEAFQRGLRELGYVEGSNIVIEARYAEGRLDQLHVLAAELLRLKVDVFVTAAPSSTRAVQQATLAIPIVMAGVGGDPVAAGFVASLARPGGNVTGLTSISDELTEKQLELLKEIVPRLSRVSVFGTSPLNAPDYKRAQLAGRALQVQLEFLDVQGPKDIAIAFQRARKGRADAGLVLTGPVLESHRTQVVELAATNRLPTIYPFPEFMKSGGLVSYGVNLADLYRRAATYVDKILKGAKPAALPV